MIEYSFLSIKQDGRSAKPSDKKMLTLLKKQTPRTKCQYRLPAYYT